MAYDNFRPWFVSLQITTEAYQALGFNTEGVDHYFYREAKLAAKQLTALETPEFQLSVLSENDPHLEGDSLKDLLMNLSSIPTFIESIHGAWKAGDATALTSFFDAGSA
jgi:uncharacterized protein YbaP (TraB family)